jgi:two-component system, NarL family, sensor histidine kinase UhpB
LILRSSHLAMRASAPPSSGGSGRACLPAASVSYGGHEVSSFHTPLRSRQRSLLRMYRTVADFTYDLEIWMEAAGKSLRYVSPSCLRMTGYAAQDALRDRDFFARIIIPEDYPQWRRAMDTGHREDIAAMDFRIRRLDGSQIWLSQETTRVFDPRGRFQGWRLSLRDVTERVQARMSLDQARQNLEERVRERTAELELSRERYRALSGYLQDRIEKERAHISREIHDVLGQDMTAMNMGLHRLERSFQETGDARLAQVAELRALVAGHPGDGAPHFAGAASAHARRAGVCRGRGLADPDLRAGLGAARGSADRGH